MRKIIKRNKKNKIIYIVLIIFIFSLFLIINYFDINSNFLSFLRAPFIKAGSILYKNQSSLFINERIETLEYEISLLKDSLDLKKILSDYDLTFATVIYRNPTYWQESLIIDKGLEDNIRENMAVVTSNGLIGKVVKADAKNATVSLISNSNNGISVGVKASEGYIHGLITEFDYKNNLLVISGINNYDQVYENSKIVTTGINNSFPSGLLVGYVKEIRNNNYNISKKLYVKSNQNLDDIRYVAVIRE